jgi:hypothetical protein
MVGGKAVTVSGLTILTVGNTGDDGRFATAGKRRKTAALCAPLFYRSEKFP